MRIAVCDDEEKFRTQAKEMIDKLAGSLDVIVDAYEDGRKLLDAFDKKPYDVLFLDIEMPAMDGITLAKKLRERSDSIYIVFLTGHVEYALEGYEVNALRYLTKPVQEDKLREVIRFVMDKSTSKRQLMIKTDGEETLINVSDIIYLEAQNQYVMIYLNDGEHLVRYNISDFEQQLKADGFFRIHRGYLVSLAKVKKLVRNEVLMESPDGEVSLPVSRTNVKPLKEALYSFVENSAM
ncbi:MAG TPA: DNA-binding response regulator [Lachnospiraceae bacterium]|jgi:two-component system response regulator LytT|nr:response regulator transcription factor [Eubacterium sp.]HBZ02628.1 DNA-binding response regulator [Lachnospiraceae bacterium]